MNPFGMGGNPAAMKKMLETAQKQIADNAEKMKERLEAARLEGSSGGGMVKATATGSGDLVEVIIAREAVDPDDVEMLQDLVVTAVREALDKAKDMQEDEQQKILPGNLNIPGLGHLGF